MHDKSSRDLYEKHQTLLHRLLCTYRVHLQRDFSSSSSRRRDTISLDLRASGLKSPPEITIFWICRHTVQQASNNTSVTECAVYKI